MFNRQGIKKIGELVIMFQYFEIYLQKLQDSDTNSLRESTFLSQIVMITIFCLFNTIEGYSTEKPYDV